MKKKYLIEGLIACGILVLIIWGKVLYMQRIHFINAENYYRAAQWKLAIREYDDVMHAYSPLSPYVEKSAHRLWDMGKMFEKEDKPMWAVDAFSAIRSSFFASRSFYTPGKGWIEKCDDEIALLDVKMLIKDGSLKPENAASERAKLLYVMKVDRAPAPGWTVVAEACFFGWVVSILLIIFRGFDEGGRLRSRQAVYGLLSFAMFFAVWILSLLKA